MFLNRKNLFAYSSALVLGFTLLFQNAYPMDVEGETMKVSRAAPNWEMFVPNDADDEGHAVVQKAIDAIPAAKKTAALFSAYSALLDGVTHPANRALLIKEISKLDGQHLDSFVTTCQGMLYDNPQWPEGTSDDRYVATVSEDRFGMSKRDLTVKEVVERANETRQRDITSIVYSFTLIAPENYAKTLAVAKQLTSRNTYMEDRADMLEVLRRIEPEKLTLEFGNAVRSWTRSIFRGKAYAGVDTFILGGYQGRVMAWLAQIAPHHYPENVEQLFRMGNWGMCRDEHQLLLGLKKVAFYNLSSCDIDFDAYTYDQISEESDEYSKD